MNKTVSSISGSLAAFLLKKSLEDGKTIEIPSLNLKFSLKDGVQEIEMGSVLSTIKESQIPGQQKKDNR